MILHEFASHTLKCIFELLALYNQNTVVDTGCISFWQDKWANYLRYPRCRSSQPTTSRVPAICGCQVEVDITALMHPATLDLHGNLSQYLYFYQYCDFDQVKKNISFLRRLSNGCMYFVPEVQRKRIEAKLAVIQRVCLLLSKTGASVAPETEKSDYLNVVW